MLVGQVLTATTLEIEERIVDDAVQARHLAAALGRDREVLELLAVKDDCLLCQQSVLRCGGPEVGPGQAALELPLLRDGQAARVRERTAELVTHVLEEGEYVVEAVRVELRCGGGGEEGSPFRGGGVGAMGRGGSQERVSEEDMTRSRTSMP